MPNSPIALRTSVAVGKLAITVQLSVIIPCLNEGERIAQTVRNALRAGADEVIIADGGSADGSPSIAQSSGARMVKSPAGRGIQLRAGAEQCTSDVLVFLHADCRLPENARQQIECAIVDDPNGWGVFRQRIEARGAIYRAIERGNAWRVRWQRLAYGDQGMFVRRALYQSVGGFDPVPLLEDVLLSQRLSRRAKPHVLPGPLVVDARRWKQRGPLRQTFFNWWLMAQFRCGASPERLARSYRPHTPTGTDPATVSRRR
jgi:rSAM/selenodomain-associated transferase 2